MKHLSHFVALSLAASDVFVQILVKFEMCQSLAFMYCFCEGYPFLNTLHEVVVSVRQMVVTVNHQIVKRADPFDHLCGLRQLWLTPIHLVLLTLFHLLWTALYCLP